MGYADGKGLLTLIFRVLACCIGDDGDGHCPERVVALADVQQDLEWERRQQLCAHPHTCTHSRLTRAQHTVRAHAHAHTCTRKWTQTQTHIHIHRTMPHQSSMAGTVPAQVHSRRSAVCQPHCLRIGGTCNRRSHPSRVAVIYIAVTSNSLITTQGKGMDRTSSDDRLAVRDGY